MSNRFLAAIKGAFESGLTRLYQLPNGNWVDPLVIDRVASLPASTFGNPAQVLVDCGDSGKEVCDCVTLSDADAMRDKIAKEINGLMMGGTK